MFSYRHAFHAGNHADVLKHTVLIATLEHLLEKDAALTVVDTHAGAGLYRLDGDYAGTSGEAADGVLRLLSPSRTARPPAEGRQGRRAPLRRRPRALPGGGRATSIPRAAHASTRARPSSPITCCATHDKLKLFELHPTDARTLDANIAQLEAGRQIAVLRDDGFGSATKFLPPPSRRALVLCDPSYEIKSDYGRVLDFVGRGAQALRDRHLRRLVPDHSAARGARPAAPAQDAGHQGRQVLAACHADGQVEQDHDRRAPATTHRPGLPASGMFLINPPYTLKPLLAAALPQMAERLAQDRNAAFSLDSGG